MDQRGVPFLLHGDAAWSLITALDHEETDRYLADRARKGFNTITVNLVEHKFNGPANRHGDTPFADAGTLTKPNEAYFAHADWVIRRAGEFGIQVLLVPMYLGYAGTDEGWIDEILASGVEGCRQWGRFLGQRYGPFDNILWGIGADREPGEALDHVDAAVEGIQEYDRRRLFTAGSAPERCPVDDFGRGGWMDLNLTYTYGIVHRRLLADYARRPVMPFVLGESTYEGEHNASALQIRRQAYWALLCGACGHVFGNLPLWCFCGPRAAMDGTQINDNEVSVQEAVRRGWQNALDATGSHDMSRVRALFESRPWYHLVPDEKHNVVTGGIGEFRGLDYAATARTSGGGTVIAYMPTARTLTVDLRRVSGRRAKAWWYDPRTGASSCAGEFATTTSREFRPPGAGDWALVLDDAGLGYPPPGVDEHSPRP